MIKVTIPDDEIEVMWDEIECVLNPKNGTKSIIQLKGIPDNIGGIYKLFSKDKTLLYIGKAKYIRRRIHQHLKSENDYLYDYSSHIRGFAYFTINDPVERDIYETYMINQLKPKLNTAKLYTYKNSIKDYKTEEMIAEELEIRRELHKIIRNRPGLYDL